jgi:predicted enzyme related to lactoylglutathione lyase
MFVTPEARISAWTLGVLVSLRVDDAQALHDRLGNQGVPIVIEPFDTRFGRTFMFADPDGYQVAIHGQAR